jgi:hypothetical protein
MRLILISVVAGVAGLGAGWFGMSYAIPYVVTDHMFSTFRERGAKENRLSPPNIRTAKTARVVRDNADTITRSSIIDLADGPLIFEAEVPTSAEYWSVSLFAHNTDTFFVANDQDIGKPTYRLAIRTAGQSVPAGVADAEAVSPTRFAFLIIRATMRDRNDAASVEALRAETGRSSLRRLADVPQAPPAS